MDCRKIRPQLDLYAGDDLDAREAAPVEAHLRSCLACYRDYTELRGMLVAVRAARGAEARPAGLRDSIVAGVMERIDAPPPALPRLLPRLSLVSGWAAAALVAVTLGWQLVGTRSDGHTPRSPARIVPSGGDGIVTPASFDFHDELGRQLDELPGARAPSRSVIVPPTPRRSSRPRNF